MAIVITIEDNHKTAALNGDDDIDDNDEVMNSS